MRKAILVGRHTPDLGKAAADWQILEQRDITFPPHSGDCEDILWALLRDAQEAGDAAVMLQNTPVVVASALVRVAQGLDRGLGHDEELTTANARFVGVVTLPGARPRQVTEEFMSGDGAADYNELVSAISFANPRARIVRTSAHVCEVSVDGPPMPFVFSHIEPLV